MWSLSNLPFTALTCAAQWSQSQWPSYLFRENKQWSPFVHWNTVRVSSFLPEHSTLEWRKSSRCTLFTETLTLVNKRMERFIFCKKYIGDIKTFLLGRFCILISAFVFKWTDSETILIIIFWVLFCLEIFAWEKRFCIGQAGFKLLM